MRVVMIVAMAENRVIGASNKLPWYLPEDLKRFKRLTMGHPMIMGRKTWDSIGRPLPGRESIVVTRQHDFRPEGATVVHSLDAAIEHARTKGADAAFVIGGGEIFRQALPRADALELTLLHRDVEGDVFFPEIDPAEWREVAREEHSQEDGLRYSFLTLDRETSV